MNLATLAVKRPIAMLMVICFILIIGTISLKKMPLNLFPELTFPVAVVTASYEGASPEEMEKLLSIPLENAMGTVANVKEVTSISSTGSSLIIVSFDWGTDMNFAALSMREKIDTLLDFLPSEVKTPKVLRFNPSDIPVIQLAMTHMEDKVESLETLTETTIKPALDSIKGVAAVSTEGQSQNVIKIVIDPVKLSSYGLTMQQLKEIIASENFNFPSGELSTHHSVTSIRVLGKYNSIFDLKNLPISTNSGIIALEELAYISQAVNTNNQMSFVNGERALGISIFKQSNTNTVQVNEDILQKVKELNDTLPDGIEIKTIFDQSAFIKKSIRAVTSNLIIGSILAAIVLFLFLRNFRSTIIISFAIPISIIATFIFLYFSNQTLNLLTLGGLALGIGMMVDNAIVILENIFRKKEEGRSIKEAAIEGTNEVKTAIVASTLTTIVVFLPIVFVNGLAAQLFKPLAMVVTFSLFASLFTAFIFVPLFSSLFIKETKAKDKEILASVKHSYEILLRKALQFPKRIIIITITLFLLSLTGIPYLGTEFLPAQDQGYIHMKVELPSGTPIGQTYETTQLIHEELTKVKEIELAYVIVGGGSQYNYNSTGKQNRAEYTILLKPKNQRNLLDTEIADIIRSHVAHIPANISISAGNSAFNESAVSLKITGPNMERLKEIASDTLHIISKVDGIREATSNYDEGNPEIIVELMREKAAFYGVGSAQVAQVIHEASMGIIASKYTQNGDEYDIQLTMDKEYISTVDDLSELFIQSPNGETIPLKSIALIKRSTGPTKITRTNRLKEITISASILNRDLGSIMKDIDHRLREQIQLPNDQYKITYNGQDAQMRDAFFKLSLALLLAVVLVYMVMAGQFESFFYPFIILFSIPLTVIGIIGGLLISNLPFSVGALIGILILTGIVVNNAIVLVDYINILKKKGYHTRDAILIAGPTRLRPIFMTSLTTILGLIPLTLGIGEGTEIQQPMAIVILFGLLVSTAITLIFIPTLYYVFDHRKRAKTF